MRQTTRSTLLEREIVLFLSPMKLILAVSTNAPEKYIRLESLIYLAGFVAHVLTTLSPPELENRCFRIEGDHTTILEIGKRVKKDVAFVDKIPGEPLNDLKNSLVLIFDKSQGSTAWDYAKQGLRNDETANDNHLWPEHKWKTFADMGLGL